MKIKLLEVILLTCLISAFTKAQEPDPSSFFPSSVRNVWQYESDHGFIEQKILRDSVDQEGNRFLFYSNLINSRIKLDTLYNVYVIVSFGDTITYHYYKLDADSGETWTAIPEDNYTNRIEARVDIIGQSFIFGEYRSVKQINYYRLPFGDTIITENAFWERYILLVSGIGEYYEQSAEEGPIRILLGCIINGDTLGTITSGIDDNEFIVSGFNLHQNYPNPFNPSTVINYQIPENGLVTLRIYDILGREVRTLVNEQQTTGWYEVNFNASDLATGVYIYKLQVNYFVSSKKMMMIK